MINSSRIKVSTDLLHATHHEPAREWVLDNSNSQIHQMTNQGFFELIRKKPVLLFLNMLS